MSVILKSVTGFFRRINMIATEEENVQLFYDFKSNLLNKDQKFEKC